MSSESDDVFMAAKWLAKESADDRCIWAEEENNNVLVKLNYYIFTVVVLSVRLLSIHNLLIIRVINEFLTSDSSDSGTRSNTSSDSPELLHERK